MSSYVLGPDAGFDLEDIWEFIAADSVDQADRWIGTLFDAFDQLAHSPGMGHHRKDLTSLDVLFWPVGNYLIVYRKGRSEVEIVGVTQGSRDIPSFLRRRLR
jgi:plasmid stabilization system protein ParE